MNVTKPQKRALTILREHAPLWPGQFARFMWPDSPGWKKTHHMMPMCGGAYLAKLGYRGWVRPQWRYTVGRRPYFCGYVLTSKGRELVNELNEFKA